ncbi:MAG: methionine ABC transporter ATP-binding protein [Ponticaulis sp.]|nr:methionine ABC transporter ATP-binding protein [Ponticaulis sp.]
MLLNLTDVEFAWPKREVFLKIDAFQINEGEQVFLRGPSGSGKSTLLGLIAGVLRPKAGSIAFGEVDLAKSSPRQCDKIRARDMGVVFQLFNLLPFLDLISNVSLPCRLSPERNKRLIDAGTTAEEEAHRLLRYLGLAREAEEKTPVSNLSVGQQQRVAAARALIGAPRLIIADEPTSALDTAIRDEFLKLLRDECAAANTALLFVSHDDHLASHFERVDSLVELNKARLQVA